MENAQAFNDAGGVSIWEYLIFQHNQHQLDQARNLSEEMNFDEIKFKRPFGFETVSGNYESIRVLKDTGEFDYSIYPADEKNHRNKNFGDTSIDRYGNNLSLYPDDFEKSLLNNTQHYEKIFKKEALRYKEQDENEISCMTKNNGEVYIDSAGKVHPCCFLSVGSQNVNLAFDSLQYFKWLENNLTEDQNNAILYPLEDIINSGFLSKIEQTWSKTHEEGRMMCCTQMCSKNKSAKRQIVYMTDLITKCNVMAEMNDMIVQSFVIDYMSTVSPMKALELGSAPRGAAGPKYNMNWETKLSNGH